MIEIRELHLGKDSFDLFFEVPFILSDSSFNEEQNLRERNQLSFNNIFFEHGEGCGFVILEEGKLKGRIFASIDKSLVKKNELLGNRKKIIGHIGYLFVDEEAYSKKLIEKAEDWLKKKGVTDVHGPLNLNILNGYRLQTGGFDTQAFPGEPRNPGYYKDFLKKSGYKVFNSWNSWDLTPQFIKLSAYHAQEISKKATTEGFSIRPIKMEKFEEELGHICDCALESFSFNYGVAQISKKEFIQSLIHLKPLIKSHLFYILEEGDGNVGGFIMGYQDDPEKPNRIVFHTVALRKKWQKTYAAYLLAFKMSSYVSSLGYHGIGAFAKEGKSTFDRLGPPTRTYSLFEKRLS